MFDVIFFDLDGTITDSGEGIMNSAVYALSKFGIEISDKNQLRRFIGPPLHWSFKELFGIEDTPLAVKRYREYYAEKGIFENSLYDGITEVLKELKAAGRTVVLATSKPENYAKQILDYFKITEYFDHVCGAEMDEKRTDKHEVIEYALETAGVTDRSKVIMIGDRLHDIVGARSSSLKSIGVTYGYGTEDELRDAGADHIAHTTEDIIKILL